MAGFRKTCGSITLRPIAPFSCRLPRPIRQRSLEWSGELLLPIAVGIHRIDPVRARTVRREDDVPPIVGPSRILVVAGVLSQPAYRACCHFMNEHVISAVEQAGVCNPITAR